jgi:hypothetical protein
MIEVKLTFKDFTEAQAFFNRDAAPVVPIELLAGAMALNDIAAEAAAPAKRTRKSKNAEAEQAQAAPAAVEPAQESTAEPEIVSEEPAEASAPSYTVDDVRKALQAYSGREGFPAATELVKSFGATRITELKAEDYAAFIAKTQEEVAA